MAFFQDQVSKGATISDCELYRYALWRVWDKAKPLMVWVMLNPSKANATEDDHTIRWCIEFARQQGYGGIRVVNLFAYRATVPADMKRAKDPVGPLNDKVLTEACRDAGLLLVAWGAHGSFMGRDRQVYDLILRVYRAAPYCLQVTNGGYPRHPARLTYKQALRPYEGRPE